MKLIQWNSDAYDQDLVERTRDACRGDVDIVIGCLGLGAPLQRSFKCLKKGGLVYVTENMNDKVLKSLEKLAEQQGRKLKTVSKGSVDDLKSLMQMVTTGQVSAKTKALVAPQFSGARSFPRSFPKNGTRSCKCSNLEKRNTAVPRSQQ